MVKYQSALSIFAALVLWGVFQTSLVYKVEFEGLKNREGFSYMEDDAINHTIKAHQVNSCLRQECAGLQDLRAQTELPPENIDMQKSQFRIRFRELYWYSPMQNFILAGASKVFGADIENTFKAYRIAGSLLIGLSIFILLKSIFGNAAALFSLALLATQFFPKQGLHVVIPSNLSLAIAFLLWGAIIKRRRHVRWSLPVLSFFLVWLHPIGQVYAFLSCVLYWSVERIPLKRVFFRKELILSGFFVVSYFLATKMVHHPLVVMPTATPIDIAVKEWNRLTVLTVGQTFEERIRLLGGWTFLLGLGFIGLIASFRRASVLIVLFAMLGFFLILSIYVQNKMFFAEVPIRLSIPIWILACGILGSGYKALLKNTIQTIRTHKMFALGNLALFCFFTSILAHSEVFKFKQTWKNKYDEMHALFMHLDQRSYETLFEEKKVGNVYYTHEYHLIYFLSKGADRLRTVYWPMFAGSKQLQEKFLREMPPSHVVAPGPLFFDQESDIREDVWSSRNKTRLTLSADWKKNPSSVEICVAHTETDVKENMIIVGSDGRKNALSLLSNHDDCVNVPAPKKGDLEISFASDDSTAYIKGIHWGGSAHQWPWSAGTKLKVEYLNRKRVLDFNPKQWLPGISDRHNVTPIHDSALITVFKLGTMDAHL